MLLTGALAVSSVVLWAPVAAAQAAGDSPEPLLRLDREARRLSRQVSGRLHLARLGHLESEARCLDRTLTEVHSVVRQLEHGGAALRAEGGERHLTLVLRALNARVAELRRQARSCVAPYDGGPSGRTVVITEIDPRVPPPDVVETPPWPRPEPATDLAPPR